MMSFSHSLTPAVPAVRCGSMFRSRILGAILTLCIPAQPVYALLASCTVSANGGVSFGVYDVFSASAKDATGDISVTCSGIGLLVGYDILVGTGNGSFASRYMLSGSHQLFYNLFTTLGYSIIWGDGSPGTAKIHDGYTLGLFPRTEHYPIYGRIPARQNTYVGSYSDTILMTINF
jgi:spore coat protein U-like protein